MPLATGHRESALNTGSTVPTSEGSLPTVRKDTQETVFAQVGTEGSLKRLYAWLWVGYRGSR